MVRCVTSTTYSPTGPQAWTKGFMPPNMSGSIVGAGLAGAVVLALLVVLDIVVLLMCGLLVVVSN